MLAVAAHDEFEGLDEANLSRFDPALAGPGPVLTILSMGGEQTNVVGAVIQ